MKYLDELKKLNLPKDKYAIFGSGPIAIRDIRKSKDIDVVVKDDLYKELLRKHKEFKPGQIKIGNIEIFAPQNTAIDNPEKVIDRAEIIEGFKFIRLDDLIKWKQKLGRPKDLKDIQLIKDYLRSK